MTRIMIVEDQTMLRDSLAALFDAQDDFEVVATLADAGEAPSMARDRAADVVLLDVCTAHNSSGINAARLIKQETPQTRTIIMTAMPEITFVDQARDAQADSFVYKNVGTAELLSIVRSTMQGYSTFPNAEPEPFAGADDLSDMELRILRMVCETKSRRQIAQELYLSEGTVKRHISEILSKTGYDSVLKLAVHAVSSGYIVPALDEGRDATTSSDS